MCGVFPLFPPLFCCCFLNVAAINRRFLSPTPGSLLPIHGCRQCCFIAICRVFECAQVGSGTSFLGGDVFLKFMLTRFKECVFKKKFHTSWLAVAPPSSRCSLPVCPKGRFALEGGKKNLGGREAGCSVGLLAGNLCANATTVCVYTHGKHLDASFSAAVPEGEQSAQCLRVAQLDPAAELD